MSRELISENPPIIEQKKSQALSILPPPDDSDSDSSESIDNKIEKVKKPYVMTEARKKAFEKARITRAENIARRHAVKEKEINEIVKLKEDKVNIKITKQKQKEYEIAKLQEESSDDEPIIVRKKKSSKKKVIYISDEEDDKRNIIIVNKMDSNSKVPPIPIAKPKKIHLFL
jgi:hypothetical protein